MFDSATRSAAVIDPVRDFDPASGSVGTRSAEKILALADEHDLSIGLVLETHPHADHLTAAAFFKDRTGAKVGIGAGICAVQQAFGPKFAASDVTCDGSEFDLLLEDEVRLPLGDCRRSRSTSAPAASHRPIPTATTISKSR